MKKNEYKNCVEINVSESEKEKSGFISVELIVVKLVESETEADRNKESILLFVPTM